MAANELPMSVLLKYGVAVKSEVPLQHCQAIYSTVGWSDLTLFASFEIAAYQAFLRVPFRKIAEFSSAHARSKVFLFKK